MIYYWHNVNKNFFKRLSKLYSVSCSLFCLCCSFIITSTYRFLSRCCSFVWTRRV